ncbi:MAG TPA: tRNA adenylyltransferase, partial [Tissierellaceae bacterium]
MDFKIPGNIIEVLNIINNNGYEAYIVGGSVRDLILNKKPNDYDITTNAKPNKIKELFKDYKTVL